MSSELARKISTVFHPISFPIVTVLLYFLLIPKYYNWSVKLVIISIVVLGTIIFPLVLLLYLKNAGFIDNFNLFTPKERKFPLLVMIIIAMMMGRLFYKMQITEDISFYFMAGAIVLAFAYLLLWFNIKLSLHTIGLGSILGFLIYLSVYYQLNFLIIISILFILFGIIAKVRLELKAHNNMEIFIGFVLGVLLQLVIPLLYQKI